MKDQDTGGFVRANVRKIQNSRKYRHAGIPDETIADILKRELARHAQPAQALRSARAILHNVMAPYLGDPDYTTAGERLSKSLGAGGKAMRQFSRWMLEQHDSTRERLPYMEAFYSQIRKVCPAMQTILDLACGLNPFALTFMGLPEVVRYHAYDIHAPRVALINRFFEGAGIQPLAELRDILIRPPENPADTAFLFKEAHRMEKRRKGAAREMLAALNARVIFVSLPNRSLDGRRDLSTRMDQLIENIFAGLPGRPGSGRFPGETLYWLERERA